MRHFFVGFVSLISLGFANSAMAESRISDELNGAQIAKKIEAMGKILEIFAPHIGKSIDNSLPEIEKAAVQITPAMSVLGKNIEKEMPKSMAFSMNEKEEMDGESLTQSIRQMAQIMGAMSRAFEKSAPAIGNAYDKSAPHIEKAMKNSIPELEQAIEEATPLLEQLGQ